MKNHRSLVFLTALAVLMFELVLARLAGFHLGESNSYLALPITFMGLALGSVHVHLAPKLVERFSVRRSVLLLCGVSLFALMLALVVFSRLMPVTSAMVQTGIRDYLLLKTLAFIALMLPPFYFFGRILTICYQINKKDIARIYSSDLFGAAIACLITPIVFHFTSLPTVCMVLILVISLPLVLFGAQSTLWRIIAVACGLGVAIAGWAGVSWLDESVDYSRYSDKGDAADSGDGKERTETAEQVEQVEHAWNEFSRVALLRHSSQDGRERYMLVHDNSRSNVHVRKYVPGRGSRVRRISGVELAYAIHRKPEHVLVLFAGCGAEMLDFDRLSRGKAEITGVELNGLIPKIARESEALADYNLGEFYDRDNIHMEVEEGRKFLAQDDGEPWDVIFMGTNAATGQHLTGHSKKYLGTVESYKLMLSRLSPNAGHLASFPRCGRFLA